MAQRCNFTVSPACCIRYCGQERLEVLGYCRLQTMPKDFCTSNTSSSSFSSSSATVNIGGGGSNVDPTDSQATFTISLTFIIIACLSLGLLFGIVGIIFLRRKITHIVKIEGLTSNEIQAFLEGVVSAGRKKKPSESTPLGAQNIEMKFESGGQPQAVDMVEKMPYDKKYEIPEKAFKLDEGCILGSGAYGIVFRGDLWGQAVAVKTVKPNTGKTYLKALLSEIKVLIHLGQHENIVSLLGAFTSQLKSGVVYVFLEYCQSGNLLNYLRNSKSAVNVDGQNSPEKDDINKPLTVDDFLTWSIQISNALRFLADKKVIHGDVATRNILLYSRDLAKLTDFGLSRRLYEYTNYVKQKQEPLPWRWMALEALREMQFSTQSDVWSFAVTMWEMFTFGDVPYTGLTWSQEFVYKVMDGLRPHRPRDCENEWYELMTKCWNNDPNLRPTFVEIHRKLASLRERNYANI